MVALVIQFILIYMLWLIGPTLFSAGFKETITDYEYINITVAEYSTVNLSCNHSNVSDVQWYLNSTNGLEEIVISGKILQIRNITRTCSSGTYVCIAGGHVTEIHILTEFPPYVDILISVEDDDEVISNSTDSKPDEPQEQSLPGNAGIPVLEKMFTETVTLICEIESSPHNSTSWINQKQWLVKYTEMHKIEKNRRHPLYYILPLDMPVWRRSTTDRYKFELEIQFTIKDGSEFGNWTCRSENKFGVDQWKIELRKKERKNN